MKKPSKKKLAKARELGVDALFTDGGHHKQWYIEQILELLGVNLKDVRIEQLEEGWCDWEPGITP